MNDIKFVEVWHNTLNTKMFVQAAFNNAQPELTITTGDQEKAYKEAIKFINDMNKIYKEKPIGSFDHTLLKQ